ncbi:MAG: integrase arm-type DNA-binding domain-containing protein [Methylococcales bacterium]
MSRIKNKLTVKRVEHLKIPGYYSDGDNLYLRVSGTLSKSWAFVYKKDGKRTEMGLGSFPDVTLENARDKAEEPRKTLKAGIDPLQDKRQQTRTKRLTKAKLFTFKQCGESYIKSHTPSWKNPKHIQQWTNTLTQYVYPFFGDLDVKEVDTGLVTQCLEPIWLTKNETAGRVRGRIESILDWATAHKYRSGDNPARWRGHLDKLLANPSKVQKTEHHSALPYTEISAFITQLRQQEGIAAKCLEFTILTASRTGETIGATWDEIDFNRKVWTIPASRMKAGKEHRVPLNQHTIGILSSMSEIKTNAFVFAGTSKGLSNMAMLQLLKRMERTDITVHGFRSSFRDWAAESTAYPAEVVEMALAHSIKNQVEAAYRRGDLLEKRNKLMEEWGRYCNAPRANGEVVPINKNAVKL